MTTNLHTSTLQRAMQMVLIALALVTGTALLLGCSEEALVAADASENAAAPALVQGFGKASNGLTILRVPQDNPGPPLYTSGTGTALPGSGFGALRTDGEWVAIAFTREPACVPPDYNLLSAPNIPAVFGCTLTIEGRVWYQNPPDLAAPPVKAEQLGLGAVPIYFAHLSEYEAAIMDGELTIVEFNGLSSLLIGYASFHMDVIQFPLNGRPGTHNIVSRGELEDGRSFQLHGSLVGTEWNTTIRFE
jgi:hypothetical protein